MGSLEISNKTPLSPPFLMGSLITLLITGVTQIRPLRETISRLISPFQIGC